MRQRRESARKDQPVYMIGVAAELAGVHPQTLRIYERKKLVEPSRTPGGTRMYSEADIERLKLIQHLTQEEGINLAGVVRIIELEIEKEKLEAQLAEAKAAASRAERRLAKEISELRRSMRADIVHVPRGRIVRKEASGDEPSGSDSLRGAVDALSSGQDRSAVASSRRPHGTRS